VDDEPETDLPCLFCWVLGSGDDPCPGHRLAARREVCEELR
jgi:hypothetical protein